MANQRYINISFTDYGSESLLVEGDDALQLAEDCLFIVSLGATYIFPLLNIKRIVYMPSESILTPKAEPVADTDLPLPT